MPLVRGRQPLFPLAGATRGKRGLAHTKARPYRGQCPTCWVKDSKRGNLLEAYIASLAPAAYLKKVSYLLQYLVLLGRFSASIPLAGEGFFGGWRGWFP